MRTIISDNTTLVQEKKSTFLSTDASSGVTSLTVQSILGFADGQIVLIGDLGNEKTEIVLTSGAPTGNTITLASQTLFDHQGITKLVILDFNQIEISWAPSATADKTILSTIAIQADQMETLYTDLTESQGYYFIRLKNSITNNYSDYSDPIPYAGLTENQVGYILKFVKKKLGHDWDSHFSQETAMQEINSCLRYIQGKLKHWSRYLTTNYAVGQTQRGVMEFNMPATIYDPYSNKSILTVRVDTASDPLTPLEEKEFNNILRNTCHSTVRTQPVVGDTSLQIANSYDFTDTGSVHIFSNNTLYSISYSGITRDGANGVLTGIPASGLGSIAFAHAVDSDVWQGEQEGQPQYFNVRGGKIRVGILPDSQWINKNISMAFYTEVTKVDSESDTINVERYDMVKHWVLWQAKNYWRNNGEQNLQDGDFLMFQDILKNAIRNEIPNQKFKMAPKINSIDYRTKHGEKRFDYT